MNIKVNGEDKTYDGESITVSELLTKNDVEMPEMVSVQINEEFVEKDNYDSQTVADGDDVEFLYFMGGGC